MSLKYRDSQGTETPVAGLNGTSGELVPSVALVQNGSGNTGSMSGSSYKDMNITFQSPMPDTDYVIEFHIEGGGNYNFLVSNIYSKTVNGFVARIRNLDPITAYEATYNWTAFKLMTDTVHQADAAHIAQNTANFAPAFSEVTSYAVGDYVTYNSVLYRCTTAHTAGVWVAGHFTQVTVGGVLGDIVPSTASSSNKLVTASDPLMRKYIRATHDATNKVFTFDLSALGTSDSVALYDVRIEIVGGNNLHSIHQVAIGKYITWRVETSTLLSNSVIGTVTFAINEDALTCTYAGTAYGCFMTYINL